MFPLVNDLALVMVVTGVANLWAQGGLGGRDAAILVGAIAVYDLVATELLPVTADLIARIAHLPFQPTLAAAIRGLESVWAICCCRPCSLW